MSLSSLYRQPPFDQWRLEEIACTESTKYLGRIVLDRFLLAPYIPRKALDAKSFSCHDACTYVFGKSDWDTEDLVQVTPTLCLELRAQLLQAKNVQESHKRRRQV